MEIGAGTERIELSHRRDSRGDDNANVFDETITIQNESASAVGSSEVLGDLLLIRCKELAYQIPLHDLFDHSGVELPAIVAIRHDDHAGSSFDRGDGKGMESCLIPAMQDLVSFWSVINLPAQRP